MLRVYLAGGFHGDWRERVKKLMSAGWLDPSLHGLAKELEYTACDLTMIKSCDVVFAYMEKDNPSGQGLVLEIGYAKGLGKTILFVDEKNDRYMGMARACADVVFDTLDEGVVVLAAIARTCR